MSQQFLTTFRPDLPSSQNFTVVSVDGGINSQEGDEAGVEAVRPTAPSQRVRL